MSHTQPDRDAITRTPPGTPRWVKVLGVILIAVILLIGIVMLAGIGGQHGPRRHAPSGSEIAPTSLAAEYTWLIEQDAQPL
jgi:hypothetical protein